jgi:DNA-directed RNA polymerase beta subunit
VFKSVFPISDFQGRSTLEFVRYDFDAPKYDVDECMQRDMTYAAPLKVKLRLIVFDVNEETGSKSIKDVKEQDVYMGDMPLMTLNGTFVINGTERVIVSQMHRSPGVFFDHDAAYARLWQLLFAARIIPIAARGSTSSSTPRTSSTCASTAAASRRDDAALCAGPQRRGNQRLLQAHRPRNRSAAGRCRSCPTRWRHDATADLADAKTGRRHQGGEAHRTRRAELEA